MRIHAAARGLFTAVLLLAGTQGWAQQDPAAPVAAQPAPPAAAASAPHPTPIEPPILKEAVAKGELPPVAERIPTEPSVVVMTGDRTIGRPGGTLRILAGSAKDTRTMVVYGYARLVGYDEHFNLVPDIARDVQVEEGRRFTFHLRRGHRWSDGEPFTSEDFRYYWEDVASDKEMSKFGPPKELLVDGEKPVVEFPDEVTVRYTWSKPNPYFLQALAGAQPLEIFRPSHYLKQFHARYADPAKLEKMVKDEEERNWVSLHYSKDRSYRNDNLDLPTLQPWVLKTDPPSDRFVFDRNPYYHRIDERGNQLPYIDRVTMTVASPSLVPAKVGSGEADLQAAYLGFPNYTFLKEAEGRSGFEVRRWTPAKGSRIALFPNLNYTDPVWRDLFRNVGFRRALSLGINRHDINNAIFYGLAAEGNNTVLKESPLYRDEYRTRWAQYDPDQANRLLDGLGLTKRDSDGIRLLPDGRKLQIVVETAGEDSEQSDVLELIRDDWQKIGVALFIKPTQREVFYNRIKAGSTQMAIWTGLENGLPNRTHTPAELAPLSGEQYQWPAWGLWAETAGQIGEEPDLEPVRRLMALKAEWGKAETPQRQEEIWHEMLSIWCDQVFTIGVVAGVDQIVAVSKRLRNVPQRGIYNFNPGAFFGMYHPDTFWLDDSQAQAALGNPK